MALVEDMSVFFDTAEFSVSATFVPVGKAPQTASVIFDSPTEALFANDALSDDYSIHYPITELVSVRSGDVGTIAGVQYRVRDVRLIGDGKIKRATLSRV